MITKSLIVQSYNGNLMRVATPDDVKSVPKKERLGLSVAGYQRPIQSEGHDIFTREKHVSEIPECLSAVSCLFPIHDAPNFARWTQAHDLEALQKMDEEIVKLQEKRKRLITAAYKRGRPITPDESPQVRAVTILPRR